ncbi:DUF3150 domain-containing protein [uncultured Shewanella sp.]|uniref:DUF3150 domain-containing protein n=1 Tax=uncultured Shewanella sp. TaxID=173975 RepID=UPI0026082CBE|nr:DUF3150 domain-containing protein [uncultured Shewanella sp.]
MNSVETETTLVMYHVGTDNVTGCHGTSTVPEADVLIDGNKVKNKNLTKNTVMWLPAKYLDTTYNPSKLLSTKVSSYVSSAFKRVLHENGIYINDVYFISSDEMVKVNEELNDITEKGYQRLDQIEAQWDTIVGDHCSNPENREIAGLIQDHALSAAEWKSKFTFKPPVPMHVKPIFIEDAHSLQEMQVRQLYVEISNEAEKQLNHLSKPSMSIGQKFRQPLARLVRKICSLAFIEPKIIAVVDYVEHAIRILPKKGKLPPSDVEVVKDVYYGLSSPNRIKEVIEQRDPTSNANALLQSMNDAGNAADNTQDTDLTGSIHPTGDGVGDDEDSRDFDDVGDDASNDDESHGWGKDVW